MNKLLILLVVGLFLVSPVYATVIFEDDFNRANSATVGNGWVEVEAGGSTSIASNKAELDDTISGASVSINQTISGLNSETTYYVNFTIQTNLATGVSGPTLDMTSTDSNRLLLVRLYDSNIQYFNGTSQITSDAIVANTDYYIELYIHLNNDTYDIYIDNTLKDSGLNLWNTGKTPLDMYIRTEGTFTSTGLIDYFGFHENLTATTIDPTAHVKVQDLYDSSNLEGLTVTWSDGVTNTTQSDGIAYYYNNSADDLTFNVSGAPLYFDLNGTSITENSTTTVQVYGAFVDLRAFDLNGGSVYNYTVYSGTNTNTTTVSSAKIFLAPNTTNSVTVQAYDGGNQVNQTYVNLTSTVTTTGRDTSTYDINGLYNSLLWINATEGDTTTYVQGFTANITGNITNSTTTTTINASFPVLIDNHTVIVDNSSYSINNVTTEISLYDLVSYVTVPLYSLNAFNISIYDEITQSLITENMKLEVINNNTATTYSTINGTIFLSLLSPNDYTIRYRNDNYTERDYYQTLVNRFNYDLDLYALKDSDGTAMVVTIRNTGGSYIEDATVQLLRYYTSCNCYEVVEMAKTSAAGEAYFNADAYDGHYKFSVNVGGVNYFLSTEPENFIPDAISGLIERSITINLGARYFESYQALTNMGYNVVYNNNTKALTFTWSDPADIVTQGCLYAEYLDGVHYTSLTPSCQSASTGSVILTLNQSTNSYRYWAQVETSTTYSTYNLVVDSISKEKLSLLNNDTELAAYFAGFIVVGIALLFSYSAIGVLVVTVVGVIIMNFLLGVGLGTAFITGFATIVLGMAAYLMRS